MFAFLLVLCRAGPGTADEDTLDTAEVADGFVRTNITGLDATRRFDDDVGRGPSTFT